MSRGGAASSGRSGSAAAGRGGVSRGGTGSGARSGSSAGGRGTGASREGAPKREYGTGARSAGSAGRGDNARGDYKRSARAESDRSTPRPSRDARDSRDAGSRGERGERPTYRKASSDGDARGYQSRSGSGRSGSGRAGSDRASTGRAGSDRGGSSRGDTGRGGASRTGSGRPSAGRTGAGRTESGRGEYSRNASGRPSARTSGRPSAAPVARVAPKPVERLATAASQGAKWERVQAQASQPKPNVSRRVRGRLSDHDRRQLGTQVGKGRVAYWEEKIIEAEDLGSRGDDMKARTLARKVLQVAPASDAARHIAAMSSYRMGRWNDAAKDLELLRGSGDASILAVLADCSRALRRHDTVEQLWNEVRELSASPSVVAETRIVMAGSLADRGRLPEAVALLEKVNTKVKKPAIWHYRVMYALADLYDRAGNIQAARRLFTVISKGAPELTDAASRVAVLGK